MPVKLSNGMAVQEAIVANQLIGESIGVIYRFTALPFTAKPPYHFIRRRQTLAHDSP